MKYLSEDDLTEIKKCLDGIHDCFYNLDIASLDAKKRNPVLREYEAYMAIIERRLNTTTHEDIMVS